MNEAWPWKHLADTYENLDSRRVPITKSKRVSGDVPYYGASGIVDYVADYIFDEDILLVSEDGANLLARTYPIAFSISGKTWVNNHAHVLRFKNICSQRFLEYYLNSISLEPYVTGMAQPKLNQKSLNSIAVPSPPLPEQERIVAILDEAFAAIATATANAEKNLANAREVFESQLHRTFERIKTTYPADTLEHVCEQITVGHVGSMASKYVDGGVPFLRSKNVRPFNVSLEDLVYIDDAFHASLKKSSLRPGDLVLVRTGYPGTAAVIPESMAVANCSDLVIVRTGPRVAPEYLCLFFNSSFGRATVGGRLVGAAQKHFNVTEAKKTLVPIPPIDMQQTVLEQAVQQRDLSMRIEQAAHRKLALLAELKQSILHKAFTGELTADKKTAGRTLSKAGL